MQSPEEDPQTVAHAEAAIQQANDVLLAMDRVLENMLDLQTFNDLLDIVRSLIKDQEQLMIETRKQQKQQVLDFLR